MISTRRRQTQAHDAHRVFGLLGSEGTRNLRAPLESPYFQRNSMREEAPSRNIHSFLASMNLKALITGYSVGGAAPNISVFFESDDSSIEAGTVLPISIAYSNNDVAIQTKVATAINNFCSGASLPVPTIDWLITTPTDLAAALATIPSGLAGAPYAAIADAPADAVTNYNVITTLLGSLTSAVNDANTKQNQIATKLNTLLSELRSAGIIHA